MPRKGSKQWPYPQELLLTSHILYSVQFLGECGVDRAKGIDVVKEAIRKIKFSKDIRRAEGQKPPKVELVISADAVAILDPKRKLILYKYPLHLISYCADDKSDKHLFTFIAKEISGNRHFCYVFYSDKCAEEITLTIGEAFDLAYKKFMETSASTSSHDDVRTQFFALQRQIQALEFENDVLRKRVAELEKLKDRSSIDECRINNQITNMHANAADLHESSTDEDCNPNFLPGSQLSSKAAPVRKRLENLVLNDDRREAQARYTNGVHRTESPDPATPPPILSPPPSSSRSSRANSLRTASTGSSAPGTPNSVSSPVLGSPKSGIQSQSSIDPFGMDVFSPVLASSEQEFIDIQAGFSRGLSFGTDDFSLEDFDPLNQK